MERRVKVRGRTKVISVERLSQFVWSAAGPYKGAWVRARGKTADAAADIWAKNAAQFGIED